MPVYNFTDGSIEGVEKPRYTSPNDNKPFIRRSIIDFSEQNLEESDEALIMAFEPGIIALSIILRDINTGSVCTLGSQSYINGGSMYLKVDEDKDDLKMEVVVKCINILNN